MFKKINQSRRQFLRYGLCTGLTIFVKQVSADKISDLIDNLSQKSDNKSHKDEGKADNKIIAVRFWPSNTYTRLTIETEYKINAKYFMLTTPDRLVVDIKNARLNGVVENIKSQLVDSDPVVVGVKVGQFDETTVRIVIYLKNSIKIQAQILEPIKFGSVSYKYRYLVDIYSLKQSNDSDLDDDVLANLQLDSEKVVVNRPTYPSIGTPTKPNKKSRKILVILDPGHGGEDPGAVGSVLKEKHVVLDIAKRLRELINQTDYMRAEMTRTTDIFIPLGTRVAIARKYKADIFVSIHADAFTTDIPSGSSVFMLSDKGASSSFAKWLAKTQNQSDEIGGISFKTRSTSINKVLLDMSQTWTRRQSSQFATLIIDNIAKIHNMHSKKVEQASFAVLKAPDIPSILVETAFISNPRDENLLKTDSFKDKVANAICDGISQYGKSLLT